MSECKFDVSWVGRCKKPTLGESEYCAVHYGMKCCSCKAQATHDCDRTGQLVCGAPLCDACDGFETPGAGYGFFGFGGHGHRSKQWEAQREGQP